LKFILFKLIVKSIRSFLKFILIAPGVVHVVQVSKFSKRKGGDVLPFLYVCCVQEYARVVGEWEGFWIDIKHARGKLVGE